MSAALGQSLPRDDLRRVRRLELTVILATLHCSAPFQGSGHGRFMGGESLGLNGPTDTETTGHSHLGGPLPAAELPSHASPQPDRGSNDATRCRLHSSSSNTNADIAVRPFYRDATESTKCPRTTHPLTTHPSPPTKSTQLSKFGVTPSQKRVAFEPSRRSSGVSHGSDIAFVNC